jgi:hypothetical protein
MQHSGRSGSEVRRPCPEGVDARSIRVLREEGCSGVVALVAAVPSPPLAPASWPSPVCGARA